MGHIADNCPDKQEKGDDVEQEAKNLLINAMDGNSLPEDDDDEDFFFCMVNNGAPTPAIDHRSDLGNNGVNDWLRSKVLAHKRKLGALPDDRLLLDSESTIHVFCNPKLLQNVRKTNTTMTIHCNAGVVTTNMIGTVPGIGDVWYHPDGIANILSLAKVSENFRVTYDSSKDKAFYVHRSDGSCRIFRESESGLYYHDLSNKEMVMVQTVAENKRKFTSRDCKKAEEARRIQNIIGRPSTKSYKKLIANNLLPNCPVTHKDIAAAERIFGPDVGSLKGKTVRKQPKHVEGDVAEVPPIIEERYKEVVLCADLMFVNGLTFFVTISRNILYRTAAAIPNMEADTLLDSLRTVFQIYTQRGFHITQVHMDGQFKTLEDHIKSMKAFPDFASKGEHVPEIERNNRTVKERMRCVWNTMPFQKLPSKMVIALVLAATFWLIVFPAENGISDTQSPREIVTGKRIDYHKHCRVEFGSYVQTYEDTTNDMSSRTIGAIALRPTGNEQGGHYFYSLSSGKILDRTQWTEIPMPDHVVERIHWWAEQEGAPSGLTFTDKKGNTLFDGDDADDVDDGSYVSVDEPDNADDHLDENYYAPIAGVDDNQDNLSENDNTDDHDYNETTGVDPAETTGVDPGVDPYNANNPDEGSDAALDDPNSVENAGVSTENEFEYELDGPSTTEEMNERYGKRGRSGLRPRKPRGFSHYLAGIAMTQHTLKTGLKIYGNAGVDAVMKELKQLHERSVMEPVDPATLSDKEKREALGYLMFLKKKRCGKIKARGCADGRKQRAYIPKQEASSPTVAIESVFLSCAIDAKEGRKVATTDIHGAFMQADMDEVVYMRLDGVMADVLAKIDPGAYKERLVLERGKPVIYVILRKALYGTLKAALLFWKRLTGHLVDDWGFQLNEYDSCVANKMINGKQCTILWHVDDLKISHMEDAVIDEILDKLTAEFGKEAELTTTRGDKHDYLGMQIDYSTKGVVKISMPQYIDEMLSELPNDKVYDGVATTPASENLFRVNEYPDILEKSEAEEAHHNIAKLLYLSKRARPDIQTAVAFLCTRVQNPDADDVKKLARVMKYLRATKDLEMIFGIDDIKVLKWWIDAAFAVHRDMKSHTGGTLSLGQGALYSTSTRQKLNATSSTEAEVVGVSDVMPQVLWTRYFLQGQGYELGPSIVYQDNQSAMLLEKNGKGSSSKRTRHINIRFFFVKDRVESGEVVIEHCPTKDMLGDFFTKPLQGNHFKRMRDQVLGHAPITPIHGD